MPDDTMVDIDELSTGDTKQLQWATDADETVLLNDACDDGSDMLASNTGLTKLGHTDGHRTNVRPKILVLHFYRYTHSDSKGSDNGDESSHARDLVHAPSAGLASSHESSRESLVSKQ